MQMPETIFFRDTVYSRPRIVLLSFYHSLGLISHLLLSLLVKQTRVSVLIIILKNTLLFKNFKHFRPQDKYNFFYTFVFIHLL